MTYNLLNVVRHLQLLDNIIDRGKQKQTPDTYRQSLETEHPSYTARLVPPLEPRPWPEVGV